MRLVLYAQREFRFVALGRLTAIWLARWPDRGWSFAGRAGGGWLLRFGPVVLLWA